jgi:hypothetical protein
MTSQARQAITDSLLSTGHTWFVLSWTQMTPNRLMMYKSAKTAKASQRIVLEQFDPRIVVMTSDEVRLLLEGDDNLAPCIEWDLGVKGQWIQAKTTPQTR